MSGYMIRGMSYEETFGKLLTISGGALCSGRRTDADILVHIAESETK